MFAMYKINRFIHRIINHEQLYSGQIWFLAVPGFAWDMSLRRLLRQNENKLAKLFSVGLLDFDSVSCDIRFLGQMSTQCGTSSVSGCLFLRYSFLEDGHIFYFRLCFNGRMSLTPAILFYYTGCLDIFWKVSLLSDGASTYLLRWPLKLLVRH